MRKEIKEDVSKWGISSPCLCIRRFNVADMFIHHNLIFRFNVNPMKILTVCFSDINKLILKLFRKTQYQRRTSWRTHPTIFPGVLKSYSHQDNRVLAKYQ